MKVLALSILMSAISFAKITTQMGWIRQMPPTSDVTAGFVVFKNDSDPVEILSAKADFASEIELHTHVIQEGIMQMRKVDKMEVPKGELVLKPHGKHLMIFGVKKALKPGEKKEIEFKLSNGKTLKAKFEVRGMKDGE